MSLVCIVCAQDLLCDAVYRAVLPLYRRDFVLTIPLWMLDVFLLLVQCSSMSTAILMAVCTMRFISGIYRLHL